MASLIERSARVAAIGVEAMVKASGLPERFQRPVAIYLLTVGCNLPGATVATISGCTKQNVSKHLRQVEDRRDEPDFDQALSAIERKLFGAF